MDTKRLLSFVGALGIAGCAHRTYYPEWPPASDVLARDPCSVSREPEIVVRDAAGKPEGKSEQRVALQTFLHGKPLTTEDVLQLVRESVGKLRAANPVFLCGLRRIELLGDREYLAESIHEGVQTSKAHYHPVERVLKLRRYESSYPVAHEDAHHIHNLGYFAPTIREFFAQSWTLYGAGERKHRCAGSNCFLHDFEAVAWPSEDWARTFARVLDTPLETTIETNFNLEVVGQTALQRKIELIYGMTSLERPRAGELYVGAAQSLPPSSFQQVLAGRLYLFDAEKNTVASYALEGGPFQPAAGKPAKADALFDILRTEEHTNFSRDLFSGVQIGARIFVMGRKWYLYGGNRGSPVSIWELDPAGQQTLGVVAERHSVSKESIVGGLLEIEGRLGYFSFSGRRLSLKTLAPGGHESTERRSWTLPDNLIPMHVLPLNGPADVAILAYEKGSIFLYPKLALLRAGDEVRQGAMVKLMSDGWYDLRPPVRTGNFVLFPFYLGFGTTLGILVYDLSRDSFFAPALITRKLPREFQDAAGQMETLQLAVSGGQIFLIGQVEGGPTLVAPIELKFG